ncbi:hypothetical protein [Nocardioides sp. SR21]|uniref:hypothetical protein n=1 Tax=Nocardioides sp. SR21 TaxID=2919501 RepID=UPI001FAA3E37|nr:hypothetical protein [Nocardioides sp. SR21]
MPQGLPRPARLATTGVKVAVAGAVLALGALGPSPAPPSVDHSSTRTYRMLDAHTCSTTGFDPGQQPLSAVVRSPAGRLRFVDFDTGWRIFTARGATTLVALCLDEPPA